MTAVYVMLAIGIVHGLVVNHDGLNCLSMQYIDIVSYAVRVNWKIVHVKKSVIGGPPKWYDNDEELQLILQYFKCTDYTINDDNHNLCKSHMFQCDR